MKRVAIITINFNGEKDTIACLDSLAKVDTKDLEIEIIVVDNGSKDESADYVRKYVKSIDFKKIVLTIIETHKNLGFAGGNNIGMREGLQHGADYILLLNNDTLVEKNFVAQLLSVADSDPKIGVVAPKIYFAKGYEFHNKYKKEEFGKVIWYAGGIMDFKNVYGHHLGVDEVDHGQYDTVSETEFASGCCLLIKKEVIEKVGMFDEKFFLYYEESDWNYRIRKAGYAIMFAPKAIIWHKNAQSAGGSGSALQDYYITRNRLIFGMKYAPLRAKIALLRESRRLFQHGRQWQKKGVADFYKRKLGKGSFTI